MLETSPATGMSEMCCGVFLQVSAGKNTQHLCSQERAAWEGVHGPATDLTSQAFLCFSRRRFLHECRTSSPKVMVEESV